MNSRFGNPLRSEFRAAGGMTTSETPVGGSLYLKAYPKFYRREDVHQDFLAMQRELKFEMPNARLIKEDIDTSFARLQFDVAPIEQNDLERFMAKRGFYLTSKSR